MRAGGCGAGGHRAGDGAAARQPAGRVRLTYAAFYGAALLLLLAGGLLTDAGAWYRGLRKPPGQPPAWMFAPAWTVILALAAQAGVLAWDAAPPAERPVLVAAFAVNAVLHFLWTPLFFRARRPDWAMVEVPLLFLSVASLMVVTGRLSAVAPWLLVPYLVWVGFAVYLNAAILRLNDRFGA